MGIGHLQKEGAISGSLQLPLCLQIIGRHCDLRVSEYNANAANSQKDGNGVLEIRSTLFCEASFNIF
jgi:hypothetical protein